MRTARQSRNNALAGAIGWSVSLVMCFPVVWMVAASFKTEIAAIGPPTLLFDPTFENFGAVIGRTDYLHHALNSIVEAGGATLASLVISVPAAYAAAFLPTRRTRGVLLWVLSTKMMPAVGSLVPIYLIFRDVGLLDTRLGLVIMFTLSNLPIIIWILYSFFKEIPQEILEAARLDGAGVTAQIVYLILPLSLPGVATATFLSIVMCWNESFWSLNLTASNAGPLSAFVASFSSPQGLFWAKLSAASTLAVTPILILCWMFQRRMVRSFAFGAAK